MHVGPLPLPLIIFILAQRVIMKGIIVPTEK